MLHAARVGVQTPRLHSVPARHSSFGDEAVDLAKAAGLILEPWQRNAVDDILATDVYGRWAAFETCTVVQRQNGKGAIIETIELAALWLIGEKLVLHSAHLYPTANEAFLRIRALVDSNADLSRHVKAIRETNGEQQIILMRGCCKLHPKTEPAARLRFIARTKGSGRGFTGQRNILDEAYALTRTHMAALIPTMSAQPNPQVNLFSTAPDLDAMPPMTEAILPGVRKRAKAAVKSGVPGRLAYSDWSMEREEFVKGDINDPAVADAWMELAWQCNPAMPRVTPDFVQAELPTLGADKFAVERCGLWPPDAGAGWLFIPEDEWLAAEDPGSFIEGSVAFAVEVSRDRRWASIAAAGKRPDGLRHVEIVEHRPGTAWVVPWLVERVPKWAPCAVMLDPGSPASSLIAALDEAKVAYETVTTRQVGAACGDMFDGFAGLPDPERPDALVRDVRHLGQTWLTDSIKGVPMRSIGDQTAIDRDPPEDSPDYVAAPAMAAALALLGHGLYAHSGPEQLDGDLMAGGRDDD